MTDTMDALPEPPAGNVKVVYMGPVAPHWDFMSDFGDAGHLEQFKARAEARLLLLPPPRSAVPPEPGADQPGRRAGEPAY